MFTAQSDDVMHSLDRSNDMKIAFTLLFALGLLASSNAFALKADCKNCTLHSDGTITCETCVITG